MKVKNLVSNLCLCFAAIFSAGCDSGSAGKNSTEHNRTPITDAPPYQSTPSVLDVVPTTFAFAALYEDGSVITWGHEEDGGDSSSVQNELKNVIGLYSTSYAFAALKLNWLTWFAITKGEGNTLWQDPSASNMLARYITLQLAAEKYLL